MNSQRIPNTHMKKPQNIKRSLCWHAYYAVCMLVGWHIGAALKCLL